MRDQIFSEGLLGENPLSSIDVRPALEAYRKRLVAECIDAPPINENEFFGHWFFQVRDPHGNLITVYTSHEIRFMAP